MNHPIFNYDNLTQLLWVKKEEINKRLICLSTCIVTLDTGEQITIRANELKSIIAENNQKNSQNIEIIERGHFFKAYDSHHKSTYFLEAEVDHISCTCDNYYSQLNFFSKPESICEHGYALLNYLGVNRLTEPKYQQAVQECYLSAEYQNHYDHQEMISYAWQDDSRYWA